MNSKTGYETTPEKLEEFGLDKIHRSVTTFQKIRRVLLAGAETDYRSVCEPFAPIDFPALKASGKEAFSIWIDKESWHRGCGSRLSRMHLRGLTFRCRRLLPPQPFIKDSLKVKRRRDSEETTGKSPFVLP